MESEEDGYTDVSMGDAADDEGEDLIAESSIAPLDNDTQQALATVNDVRRALHPLQATADRLGKQVENFATTLDRLSNKRQKTDHPDCRYVIPHVREYQKIASETVLQLKKSISPEKRRSLSKSKQGPRGPITRSTSFPGQEEILQDLKRWETEEQTWDLLASMLQVQYPVPDTERSTLKQFFKDSNLVRPSKTKDLHKYSSEKEIWDNHLACNDEAWEQHTVLEWLRKCADKSGQDIDEMVEELESEADRGSGLAAPSWLYTKEAIKGQKRLRSWPKALEPDGPGLETSLVGSSHKQPLVTQLDPDAISRQGRHLEKEDQVFERALWLACWEMLRRGKDWDFIHSWLQEKGELWRSTAVRGNVDMLASLNGDWRSRMLWRKTCAVAAREGTNDSHESAFYGVLSGHFPSVDTVSRCWDDHLFAHYNAGLLRSFEDYVRAQFADRYPSALAANRGVFDFDNYGCQRQQIGTPDPEKEATSPLKMLQGNLVAQKFDQYMAAYGVHLSEIANATSESKILPSIQPGLLEVADLNIQIDSEDYDMLRILTHTLFVFQDMAFSLWDGPKLSAIETIVVAYIDFLGKAGKQQLLPLYASRLSRQRSIICMARQLPMVLENSERRIMMKLMQKYGIPVDAVLGMQLQLIMEDAPPFLENLNNPFPKLRILEPTNSTETEPSQIKPHFIGEDITEEQYDLIHGLEWFMLLEGHWQYSMCIGTTVYKYFLRIGALAAARLLSRNVTFSNFSFCKTQAILGYVTDISNDNEFEADSHNVSTPSKKHQKTRKQQGPASTQPERIRKEREILLDQSRSFRDLENLFVALDAMETWKDLAIDAQV